MRAPLEEVVETLSVITGGFGVIGAGETAEKWSVITGEVRAGCELAPTLLTVTVLY